MVNWEQCMSTIVSNPFLHAKWLNTLSYLENCGAKMIARCEHPTMVPKEILKHAAEEFRHAYYLKSQISKVYTLDLDTYRPEEILGGYQSRYFLSRLNIRICKFLKTEFKIIDRQLKEYAYILVTYAIEMRAKMLYPLYQHILHDHGSSVSVMGIIREEEQHLKEIEEELHNIPHAQAISQNACQIETCLFDSFAKQIMKETRGNL